MYKYCSTKAGACKIAWHSPQIQRKLTPLEGFELFILTLLGELELCIQMVRIQLLIDIFSCYDLNIVLFYIW